MSEIERQTAVTNPLYHIEAYGIMNPWVQWALERGVYQEAVCPHCSPGNGRKGYGYVRAFSRIAFDPDDPAPAFVGQWHESQREKYAAMDRWKRIWQADARRCAPCGGTGFKPAPELNAGDFGDQADLDVARKVIKNLPDEHPIQLRPAAWGESFVTETLGRPLMRKPKKARAGTPGGDE